MNQTATKAKSPTKQELEAITDKAIDDLIDNGTDIKESIERQLQAVAIKAVEEQIETGIGTSEAIKRARRVSSLSDGIWSKVSEHFNRGPETAGYANLYGYSDIRPFQIIERKTENKILIREMQTLILTPAKCLGVGGFAGNFDNKTQEWQITEWPEMPTIAIRFSKAKQQWQDKHGQKYQLSDKPVKFYDFNF